MGTQRNGARTGSQRNDNGHGGRCLASIWDMGGKTLRIAISIWLVFGFSVIAVALAQHARADVACEHRSAAHYSEHGGLKADSVWHVSKGQLPTCDTNKGPSKSSYQDDTSRDDSWGDDDFGFHCTWHGCG